MKYHIYLPADTDVNEVNVRDGYAFYYPFFPFSKKTQFAADEQAAIAAKKGLWGACTPTPTDDEATK
jgi:endonuclease YncB( thermonuclease family)